MKHNGNFKKVIGIFLILALLLTFFSRTIYNFNLPVVTVVQPAGGILIDKVEKTALITYADINSVYAEADGKVKEVLVAQGGEVKKGSPLIEFYIDEEEIDGLKLEIQTKQSDIALLHMKLSALQPSESFDEQIASETQKLQTLEEEIAALESELAALLDGTHDSPQVSEYKHNIKVAEDELERLRVLEEAGAESRSKRIEAENNLASLKLRHEQHIQSEIDTGTDRLASKRELATVGRDKLLTLNREKGDDAKKAAYDISDLRAQIQKAEAELAVSEKKLAKAQTAVLVSDYDGTVVKIDADNNRLIHKNDILMQLVSGSELFEMEVFIDEEEQELITTDGKIEVKVNGMIKSLTGKILSSDIEQKDGESKLRLTIGIESPDALLAHRNATVLFSSESEKYEVIVPSGAVRKSEKGYYVLVLKETQTSFGKSYLAYRTYVDVLDSDSTLTAISGLTYFEPIIETSTAPVDHGSRVKYEEE